MLVSAMIGAFTGSVSAGMQNQDPYLGMLKGAVIGAASYTAGALVTPVATGAVGLATESGFAVAMVGNAAGGFAGSNVGHGLSYLFGGADGGYFDGFGKTVGIPTATAGLTAGLRYTLSTSYQLQTHQTVMEYADRRGAYFTKGLSYAARTQGIDPTNINYGGYREGVYGNHIEGDIEIYYQSFYTPDGNVSASKLLLSVWHEDQHRLYFQRALNTGIPRDDLARKFEEAIINYESLNHKFFQFLPSKPDLMRSTIIERVNDYRRRGYIELGYEYWGGN